MSDLLDMAYINSLPQPFFAQGWGSKGDEWMWPVQDICVETGLVRIDVCGKLDRKDISDFKRLQDADGTDHDPDDFYLDSDRAMGAKDASAYVENMKGPTQ